MFHVAIVDDEAIVREGLKTFVNWGELGFHVAFDADCAQEALEQLDLERIDVILTDIMMPDMDGLELIKRVKQTDPNIKTVILSGYEQFHYAREAIRNGAYDFLSKPVDFEDLRTVFRQLRQLLEEERKQRSREQAFVTVMREQWLNNLIRGTGDDAETVSEGKLEETGMLLARPPYRIVAVAPEGHAGGTSPLEIRSAVRKLAERMLESAGGAYGFYSDRQEVSVLLCGADDDRLMCERLTRLAEGCGQQFGIRLHIGAGLPFTAWKDAGRSYREACKAKDYGRLKNRSVVQFEAALFPGQAAVLNDERKMKLLSSFVQGDEAGLLQEMDGVFEQALGLDAMGAFAQICAELLALVRESVQTYTGLSEQENRLQLTPLFDIQDRAEMKRYVEESIRRDLERVRHCKENTSGAIVENVKAYIQEHYNEDIQLNDLSEKFYVHPVYLSKLFKDRTGENYIDYLSRIRIVKSKELLKNLNLKIYEVADMVGYGSPKYYGTLFKKMTGMTPKEYRDQSPVG